MSEYIIYVFVDVHMLGQTNACQLYVTEAWVHNNVLTVGC